MATVQQQLEETLALALARKPAQDAAAPPTQGPSAQGPLAGRKKDTTSFFLAAERIRPDADQVRRMGKNADDPAVRELAESIRQYGVQHALDVRWIPNEDVYELVSGERRFVAATQIVGLKELPVRVVDRSEEEVLILQLTENIQRADLHPLDLAAAIRGLTGRGLSLAEVGKKLSKSEAWVQKALTVSKTLTPDAQAAAAAAKVGSLDVLYDVAQVPAEEQAGLVRRIAEEKLTRDEVRAATAEGKKRKREQDSSPARNGRPAKSKPFVKKVTTSGGATVTVQFRKAKATPKEVAEALREALAKATPTAEAA